GSPTLLLGQLCGTLQKPRMHIEHVAGISLASWRLAGQQCDLTVAGGVLRQVVDDNQGVLTAIAKILRHGKARERCDPLQPWGARRPRHHDDAALGRSAGLDRVNGAPDARTLLANRDIDANDVARLLIDNCIDRYGGFADGAVADDEFALAAAEGSIGSNMSVTAGPFPSSGRPSGSTTRPRSAGPTGTRTTSPVRCTLSPASIASTSSNRTQPTWSRSRTWAKPNCPLP